MSDKKLIIEYKRTEDGLAIEIHGTPGVNWAKFVKRSHDSIIKSLEEQYNKEDDTDDDDEAKAKEEAIKSLAEIAEKSVEEIKKEIKEADPKNEKSGFAQVALKYVSKAAKDLLEDTKKGKKNE